MVYYEQEMDIFDNLVLVFLFLVFEVFFVSKVFLLEWSEYVKLPI